MKIYKKWRELKTDPFNINFKNIKILNQISFPHCGNDVVECESKLAEGGLTNVFVKIERSTKASFETEIKHLDILFSKNIYKKIPKIIEFGDIDEKKYIVLEKINGSRLSDLFLEIDDQKLKNDYLIKYGKELATIHNISSDFFQKATQRSINDLPSVEKYKNFDSNISQYIEYLIINKPIINYDTFIHGDFHYGNILWEDEKISGVLDWEYSGKGFKEQDIAWTCILRSTQHFMDSINDIKNFLIGYKMIGNFDNSKLRWCLINGFCHFYLMNKEDKVYCEKLTKLLSAVYNSESL